jgi:hypothetical protein
MNRTLYVAGPMSGLPDLNYPAFHAAARELRAAGHLVLNPAENPEPPCGSWLGYMRMAVAQVARADAVVLLPGWERSKGARVEFDLARGLGLEVLSLDVALSVLAGPAQSRSDSLTVAPAQGEPRQTAPAAHVGGG